MSKVVELSKKKEEVDQIELEAQNMARVTKITKIKITKESPHFLTIYHEGMNAKCSKNTIYTGYEGMFDEDYFLIQSLVPSICEILQLPSQWVEELEVSGITFNYDEANEGVLRGMVVTMQRTIDNLNCPLNINTPFIKFQDYVDDYSTFPPSESVWNNATFVKISSILHNSFKYMCGNTRTQQKKLFA